LASGDGTSTEYSLMMMRKI